MFTVSSTPLEYCHFSTWARGLILLPVDGSLFWAMKKCGVLLRALGCILRNGLLETSPWSLWSFPPSLHLFLFLPHPSLLNPSSSQTCTLECTERWHVGLNEQRHTQPASNRNLWTHNRVGFQSIAALSVFVCLIWFGFRIAEHYFTKELSLPFPLQVPDSQHLQM